MSDKLLGSGADIFIRKVKPGPTVGFGYVIDVYENGIKQKTLKAKNKKEVLGIIREYKGKYHTNRAFQNEQQVHITYKTKEERGETAMETLDTILIKKAARIGDLLQRLVNPDSPVKTRVAVDVANNTTSFIPETALPNGSKEGDAAFDPKSLAKKVATKLAEYLSSLDPNKKSVGVKTPSPDATNPANNPKPAPAPAGVSPIPAGAPPQNITARNDAILKTAEAPLGQNPPGQNPLGQTPPAGGAKAGGWPESDEMYNTVKKWLAVVKKKIDEYEKSSGQQVDKQEMVQLLNDIVHSGDPAKIKAETGIDLSPEGAVKLKEVTLMSAGNPQASAEKQPQDLTSGTFNKAAMEITPADILNKMEGSLNTMSTNDPEESSVKEIIADMGEQLGIDEDQLEEAIDQLGLDENESPTRVQVVLLETGKEDKESEDDDSDSDNSVGEMLETAFWSYAERFDKKASVEDVFATWANNENVHINDAKIVWKRVLAKVDEFFRNKEAMAFPAITEGDTSLGYPGEFQPFLDAVVEDSREIETPNDTTRNSEIVNTLRDNMYTYLGNIVKRYGVSIAEYARQNPTRVVGWVDTTVAALKEKLIGSNSPIKSAEGFKLIGDNNQQRVINLFDQFIAPAITGDSIVASLTV